MKRIIGVETDDLDSRTETESLVKNTSKRLSDHKIETSPSVKIMSEEVARQIRTQTDPLSHQIAHFCDLMRELKNQQVNRRHEETASSRSATSSSDSSGRSDRSAGKATEVADKFALASLYSECYINGTLKIINESSMKHQWNIDVSEMNTLKTLMIVNVWLEIINISLMLHWCRIVVSLMNTPLSLMTTFMNHQCYQCVLDWGQDNKMIEVFPCWTVT